MKTQPITKQTMEIPKSNCCNALVKTIYSDEGTNYWTCWKCRRPCDIKSDKPTKITMKKKSAGDINVTTKQPETIKKMKAKFSMILIRISIKMLRSVLGVA